MAANKIKTFYINLPFEQVYPFIGQGLNNIGAKIEFVDTKTGVFTSTKEITLTSWGEKITITPFRTQTGCSLQVKSECILPTQVFDWGKNEDNIQKLAIEFGNILHVQIVIQ